MELYLPTHHYPISLVTNNQIIIETIIESKNFSQEQIYLINIVRIKLQLIFISDLLEYGSNRVKENF